MRPARAPRGWPSGRSVRGPQCPRAGLGPQKNGVLIRRHHKDELFRFRLTSKRLLRDFKLVISRAYTRDIPTRDISAF